MSEKRFTLEQWTEESLYFSDGEFSAHMSIGYICKKVEKKLNEQQATLTKLKELNDDKGKRIISLIRTNKTLKEENEQLRQKLDFYLLDEFEWKEKYGD